MTDGRCVILPADNFSHSMGDALKFCTVELMRGNLMKTFQIEQTNSVTSNDESHRAMA